MKLDFKFFLEFIRNFSANFAVASFVLALFEKNTLGFIVGAIFFIIAIMACVRKKKGDE